jgi:NAD(P)H-hydrate repair Nnr-like enzyme with NAD(P)H-hydrate epimerase domain
MRSAAVRASHCYLVIDGMMGGGFHQVMEVPTKPATAGRVVCKAFL